MLLLVVLLGVEADQLALEDLFLIRDVRFLDNVEIEELRPGCELALMSAGLILAPEGVGELDLVEVFFVFCLGDNYEVLVLFLEFFCLLEFSLAYEKEALELDEDGLDCVGGGPPLVEFLLVLLEHIKTDLVSEDVRVLNRGVECDLWGLVRVGTWKFDLEMEYTTLVLGVLRAFDVRVPEVEVALERFCGDTDGLDRFFLDLFPVMQDSLDGVILAFDI